MPRRPPRTQSIARRPQRTRNSDPEGWSLRRERPAHRGRSFLLRLLYRLSVTCRLLLAPMTEHIGINDIDRLASRKGNDLVENVCELNLVFVARDIADMR